MDSVKVVAEEVEVAAVDDDDGDDGDGDDEIYQNHLFQRIVSENES